jgi:phosphonate transport system ATP-binding protein
MDRFRRCFHKDCFPLKNRSRYKKVLTLRVLIEKDEIILGTTVSLSGLSAKHPAAKASAPAALRELSLDVSAGEHIAVIGPSGAGKTSLLHVLACALKPSGGVLEINNQNPWTLSKAQLQVARGDLFLAPQVPPLPPRQRVVTAVLAGKLPQQSLLASLKSLFYPSDIALAERALTQFDLSEKIFDRVDRLSGGERQRVGLARLLASTASLLLVDEPLSALDPTRSKQAIATLREAASLRGATLIATLHQVDVAIESFPRVVGLRDGKVAFDLPATKVTKAMLTDLYSQHLDELDGPAPIIDLTMATPASSRAQMQCR